MRILALDVGDVWTGTAISDPIGLFARPYQTIETKELEFFLTNTIQKEKIKTVVVGYPRTMRGTESEQTKKVKELFHTMEKKFAIVEWKLWDERLSSKRAAKIKKGIMREEKKESHSVAAAFILDSYLNYLHSQTN